MHKTRLGPMRLTPDYHQLQRQLAHIGYLSQGSVFERTPGQQGSPYVWTRKVHAKTITVAIRGSGMKVQASIQGDTVRVNGAKRDVLQDAIAFVKKNVTDFPLKFGNFRD